MSVCERRASPEEIAGVVGAAAAGGAFTPASPIGSRADLDHDEWSSEERAWLHDLASGASIDELATKVGFSRRTMIRRLRVLYRRLGVDRQGPALAAATRLGLIA